MKYIALVALLAIFLMACNGNKSADNTTMKIVTNRDSADFPFMMAEQGIVCTVIEHTSIMKDSLCKEPLADVNVGDSILIIYATGNYIVKNQWEQMVFKVKCRRVADSIVGYLTQDKLALNLVKVDGGKFFVLGIEMPKPAQFQLKGMLIDEHGTLLQQISLDAIGGSPSFSENIDAHAYMHDIQVTVKGNKGLDGLLKTICVAEMYGACGYLNGETHIGWDGKSLYKIISDASMSEAGLFANYYELVFPDDNGGKKAKIIERLMHSEEEEGAAKSAFDSTVIEHSWQNGKGIIAVDTVYKYTSASKS